MWIFPGFNQQLSLNKETETILEGSRIMQECQYTNFGIPTMCQSMGNIDHTSKWFQLYFLSFPHNFS